MKLKAIYLLAIFILLTACSPQTTAAPEATATLPVTATFPPPTHTLEPPDPLKGVGKFLGESADGVPYGFGGNNELIANLLNEGWKLIEDSQGYISGSFNAANNTCSVAMPVNLITGSLIGESENDTIAYYFPDGAADQEGWWQNIPLPEGDSWRCIAVVAQKGNHLGPDGSELRPGTTAIKYVNENDKAELEIADGFLQNMWDVSFTADWERTDIGIKLVVKGLSGSQLIIEERVLYFPIDPELIFEKELQRFELSIDDFKMAYDADGKIELRQKGTNTMIYWDGRWSTDHVIDLVVDTKDCDVTDFVHQVGTNSVIKEQSEAFKEYRLGLYRAANEIIVSTSNPLPAKSFRTVPIKGTNQCWGLWFGSEIDPSKWNPTYFAWMKSNQVVDVVKVFDPEKIK
jgi:hypothetical protein